MVWLEKFSRTVQSFVGVGFLFSIGCQPTEDSNVQNNGKPTSLNSARARVTGALIGQTGLEVGEVKDPMCTAVPTGDAGKYIDKCEFFKSCTATLVKDSNAKNPFVISAAHCDPQELLTPESKAGKSSNSAGRLFLFLPSSQSWIQLENWTNNPLYSKASSDFKVEDQKIHQDIAVAKISVTSLENARNLPMATIELKVPALTPPVGVTQMLESDFNNGNPQPFPGLPHFVTSFDRAKFDAYPTAELLGFGSINSFVSAGDRTVFAKDEDSCKKMGGHWENSLCTVGGGRRVTENTQNGLTLRSVNLKVAFSSHKRATAIFLAPNSNSKAGTCQGDSGGPSFLGTDNSTRLFAIESYGPSPCAGAPTLRTVVASHLPWILKVISN